MEEITKTIDRTLHNMASALSVLLMPFWFPVCAFLLMFQCTYLHIMPFSFRWAVIGIVAAFTMLLPLLFMGLYLWFNRKDKGTEISLRNRLVLYALTLVCFMTCVVLMHRLYFPRYMSNMLTVCILCLVVLALCNLLCRVSSYTAASGLFVGGLCSYSFLFGFNPLALLCVFLVIAGLQGFARMQLGHSLGEVFAGFGIGVACGLSGILFL